MLNNAQDIIKAISLLLLISFSGYLLKLNENKHQKERQLIQEKIIDTINIEQRDETIKQTKKIIISQSKFIEKNNIIEKQLSKNIMQINDINITLTIKRINCILINKNNKIC